MRVLFFNVPPRLDETAVGLVEDWCTRLEEVCSKEATKVTVVLPPPDQTIEHARRAIWVGEPFLFAGRGEDTLDFINRLDKDSVALLADCAYWWALTDAPELTHPALAAGRPVLLNWNHNQQNIIRDALHLLASSPDLKGLSASTDQIRKDILRIARGRTGPNRSALILGASGCGKELVFQALVAHSERQAKPRRPTGGAWLNMEPGMAMTELLGLVRNLREEWFPGLLQLFSDGSLFVDDFESAPKNIQETLLRIMEDEKGEYYPVGGSEPRFTNAWLLFATNRNLAEFLNTKDLRPDFFYRFGTRIISIPPLPDRPADIPAVAHAIWEKLWRDAPDATGPEPLRTAALRRLVTGDIDWSGNTRTLRAALELLVSMMCNPEYNGYSQSDLISLLLARGRSPLDWLRIFERKPPASGKEIEEKIRKSDDGHPRKLGPSKRDDDPLEVALTPSEGMAMARLTRVGWARFRDLCRSAPQTKGKQVRVSVRLARIIWYISVSQTVNWKTARALTGAAEATARGDLAHLAGGAAPLLRSAPDSQPPAYERVPDMFI